MIIIIIRLPQPTLRSPPFLRDFANEEQSSILGMVRKERHLRYLANLGRQWPSSVIQGRYHQDHCRQRHLTPRSPVPKFPPPHPAQGRFDVSQSDTLGGQTGGVRQVCVREREVPFLTDTIWCDDHRSLFATWMRTRELNNAANFVNQWTSTWYKKRCQGC